MAAHRLSKTKETLRTYASDWKDFTSWCFSTGVEALPATEETVTQYLLSRSEYLAPGTLRRRLAAIVHHHDLHHYPIATQTHSFREFWSGLQDRTLHEFRTPNQIKEVRQIDIRRRLNARNRKLILAPSDSLVVTRDRAVVLVGIAGDLLRPELTDLTMDDLQFMDDRVLITVRHGGTKMATRRLEVLRVDDPMICPLSALKTWITRAESVSGPVFRSINRHGQVSERKLSDVSILFIIRRAAETNGEDPSAYSADDLRQHPYSGGAN